MLAVVWLDEAIADLIDIVTFIAATQGKSNRRTAPPTCRPVFAC